MDISFEFFPPKTPGGIDLLLNTANQLNKYHPTYFSVTYGAGGSTQERTLETVNQLKQAKYTVAPHISCIGASKATISELLHYFQQNDIHKLVCLRGDLPSGTAVAGGDFRYAAELVAFIRETTGSYFYIDVAAYPEAHPQSPSIQADLVHFKEKVDAGANSAITQYFYDANAYYQLLDDCARMNINLPITPGIMPINNCSQLKRFSDMCGAEIPRWIRKRLESYGDDVQSLKDFGVDVVTQLCEQLLALGAPDLHFYTLNRADTSQRILQQLHNKQEKKDHVEINN